MRQRRHIPNLEALETRVVPDAALGPAAAQGMSAPLADHGLQVAEAGPAVVPGPGRILDLSQNPLYLQELEAFFSSPDDLEKSVAALWTSLPEATPASTADALPAATPSTRNGTPQPEDPVLQGWSILRNYALRTIHGDERKYGLSFPEPEDMVHQVTVEWLEQVGTADKALPTLLAKDGPEWPVLKKTVRRVIDRVRYDLKKQTRMARVTDLAAPARSSQQDWIDMQIDLDLGVGKLAPKEREVLELRRQGQTCDEIGIALGMSKQRVSEMCRAAVASLQAL
jgi:sigma-70-like protein